MPAMLPRATAAYAAHVPVTLRDASHDDLPAIVDVLNVAVDTTTVYSERTYTLENRQAWLDSRRARGFPVIVAERGGAFAGFGTYGDFRDSLALPGYRTTVEHSVYVAVGHEGGGVGRIIVEALVDRASAAGIHVMVGAIDAENEASIRFHERLGFVEVGRMPEIATKWERWLTLVLMQRVIA
jgi:phosphinothricin acetyltransferase